MAVAISFAAVVGGSVNLLLILRPDMLPTIALWLAFSFGFLSGAAVAWANMRRAKLRIVEQSPDNWFDTRQRMFNTVSDLDDRLQEALEHLDTVRDQIRRIAA